MQESGDRFFLGRAMFERDRGDGEEMGDVGRIGALARLFGMEARGELQSALEIFRSAHYFLLEAVST